MPQNLSNLANRDIHHDRFDAKSKRAWEQVCLDKLYFLKVCKQDVLMESPVEDLYPNPDGSATTTALVMAFAGPGFVRMALDGGRLRPDPGPEIRKNQRDDVRARLARRSRRWHLRRVRFSLHCRAIRQACRRSFVPTRDQPCHPRWAEAASSPR